jgi:hypothetical protein|nr:MAG TPA: hypothetical protein [Caudoviricetes sp.]
MSEELKKGIPKGTVTGKVIFTKDEEEESERIFERILKASGAMKQDESIADWRKQQK